MKTFQFTVEVGADSLEHAEEFWESLAEQIGGLATIDNYQFNKEK